MDKEGGGEGEVGQGGAVAGQGDWKAPVPEGRFPLFVNSEGVSQSLPDLIIYFQSVSVPPILNKLSNAQKTTLFPDFHLCNLP